MPALFGKTFDMLARVLDYRAERHKVIASNIANIETPGYQPNELTFEKELLEAELTVRKFELSRTHPRHFPTPYGKGEQFPLIQSGDTVEIDKEMANLSENNLMYNFTVELLMRKFRGLNTVLKETK